MTCPRSKSWWMPSALFIKVILSSLLCPHPNRVSLAHSCMLLVMDWRAWKAAIHGAAEGWARLSDFTFTFHFHALEKEMATHSNVLAWRIPDTGEPGGLPSVGSHRVRHDWSDLAAAAGYIKHIHNVTMTYIIYVRSKEQFKALGKLGSIVSILIPTL